MDRATAMPIQLADCAVKQECPQCSASTLIVQSRETSTGRYRRFKCKNCQHCFNVAGSGAKRARHLGDAAVMAIRQSTDSLESLAAQHGCSRELIRQIRSGLIYKDLLPEWFRAPARASDPTCKQCKFYVEAKPEQIKVDAQDHKCDLGIPEFETQGLRAIRDCSAVAIDQQPPHSGPAAPEPISDALLS